MRVLLIEDDRVVAQSVEHILGRAGHNVYATDLGEDGIEIAKLYDYDIIVLDLSLPDLSGHEVLMRLRSAKIDTPVLILSGFDSPEHKIAGLTSGAADYLTKPFQKQELLARINAIVRRAKGHAGPVIEVGEIAVNLDDRTVEANGKPVRLTRTEYALVELLALRKGDPVTKEMLLDHLYGEGGEAEPKVMDGFMYKVRRKLAEATGGRDYIETAWGRGYTLREPQVGPDDGLLGTEAGGASETHEKDRLAALRRYDILDTAPESAFDRITEEVARTFGVPIALISLVDENRQWFKSRCGLDMAETPRETSFCKHAIRKGEILVVPDATTDPRFANNPLVVRPPAVSFYAGAVLSAPGGQKIGTLCVLDTKPRAFTESDQEKLGEFAAKVVRELDRRLAQAQTAEETGRASGGT